MTAWIARDKDGALYMYKVKPYRGKADYEDCWDSDGDSLALRSEERRVGKEC